jgi:hypothetical protein
MVADDVTRRILASYETGELIMSCAWCRRVEIDEAWRLAPSSALAAIADFTLTHGVCPTCQKSLLSRSAV